jgi:hypothetical protein
LKVLLSAQRKVAPPYQLFGAHFVWRMCSFVRKKKSTFKFWCTLHWEVSLRKQQAIIGCLRASKWSSSSSCTLHHLAEPVLRRSTRTCPSVWRRW